MQNNISDDSAENHLEFKLKPSRARRIGVVLICVTLLTTLGLFAIRTVIMPSSSSSADTAKNAKGKQGIPVVTVAKVSQKTVPVQLQAIGHVQAEATVSVTPQVGGQINGVYFKKGQDVKKGQLLVTLDDRTETAAIQQVQGTLAKDRAQVEQAKAVLNKDSTQVGQAKANLAKDQAQAQFAQAQAGRYNSLLQQGAVSKDQAQQYSTNSRASEATLQADNQAIANAQAALSVDQAQIENAEGVVKADEGTLDSARVQLSYTKIYAPIDGRAGDILVNPGNVVQPNSNSPLLTIDQIHPIQVSFAIPEVNLPQIRKYARNNKLNVNVNFPNSNGGSIPGVLTFINNTVDNSTGTIQLLGKFDNSQGQLWPGQYVNTTLTLTTQPNATVVPSQAVQNGPNGQFVFVLQPDSTVRNVPVTVSSTMNGLNVIQQGLQPGETVVTDGQANLISGNKVRIKGASQSTGNGDQGTGTRRRRGGSGGDNQTQS